MQKKKCTKCEIEKDLTEFCKRKIYKDGYNNQCKKCENLKSEIYRNKNKEYFSEYGKIYRQEKKEKLLNDTKEYYKQNPEKYKEYIEKIKEHNQKKKDNISDYGKRYRELNKKEITQKKKIYYQKNKVSYLEQSLKYKKNKYKNNINFRIESILRTRLYGALIKGYKIFSAIELLGCSIDHLKTHLSNQFIKGMTFENYGTWHIDHVKPCAKFDLTKPEQQKECFNYKNLQPLWAKDNLSKGSKY